jgi:phosphoribosyl 1,2-cyclic phosphodiesterase
VKLTVLGSGSQGNALLVESGGFRLLVDAGFSGRDLQRRLAEVEVEPESISALLATHDHGDHTRGMGVFARRWGTPLYLTPRTRHACRRLLDGSERVRPYASARPLRLGPLVIDPFLTVHDAVDPVAVTVTEAATGEKLGIATDLGRATHSVRHALRGCDLLILEANHDDLLLHEAPYPWSVKARIGGSHGHLSNRAAAELVSELHHAGLALVVLAHLSESANTPTLAASVVGAALERLRYRGALGVASQDHPLEPIDIAARRRRGAPAQLSLF